MLVIVIGIFSGKLQVLLAVGSVGLLLVHTVLVKPFATDSLTRLEIMLLTCCFLTFWAGGVFVVYPECQAIDRGERHICLIGEVAVLVFNVTSCLVGLGAILWFNWMENRDKLVQKTKTACATMSRWRVCQPCCLKGFGLWLRMSEAEWTENPLDKAMELRDIRTHVLGDDAQQAAGVKALRGQNERTTEEIKALRGQNERITEENKALREENNALREKLRHCKTRKEA